MTVKVVDASVVAAILFGEPESDQALAMLAGFTLIAPRLLTYEITNVAITKQRRHPELRATIKESLSSFPELGITLFEVDVQQVYDIAAATQLSGYDAAYLWLSQDQRASLATFDRKLKSAALL